MDILLHTYTLKVPFFLRNVRHTGIEVFGKEYTFSMSGITVCNPRRSTIGHYVKSYKLAYINLTHFQFQKILDALEKIYKPNTYNFIYKNCNHFCDDLFHLLCGKRLLFKFMFYSRLGKVLGKMKNIGFCGSDTVDECSASDDLIYHEASKLSKLIINGNEKNTSCESTNWTKSTAPSLSSRNIDQYRRIPHPQRIAANNTSNIIPVKPGMPALQWYNHANNIIKNTKQITPYCPSTSRPHSITNRNLNIEKMKTQIDTIAENVKKGNPVAANDNSAFRTIHSFSTACSI